MSNSRKVMRVTSLKAALEAYAKCAKIADQYNKDDFLPGIQTGVVVAAAAIASQIRSACAAALKKGKR